MFFSAVTKNLNQEISTKNLVTFKKKIDGVKEDETLGRLPKKGGLESLQI